MSCLYCIIFFKKDIIINYNNIQFELLENNQEYRLTKLDRMLILFKEYKIGKNIYKFQIKKEGYINPNYGFHNNIHSILTNSNYTSCLIYNEHDNNKIVNIKSNRNAKFIRNDKLEKLFNIGHRTYKTLNYYINN